jgi:hypothetical protein
VGTCRARKENFPKKFEKWLGIANVRKVEFARAINENVARNGPLQENIQPHLLTLACKWKFEKKIQKKKKIDILSTRVFKMLTAKKMVLVY